MTRILLLAAAMVLAMSLCLAHAEEAAETEAAEAVSTTAYIFWQDSDWWPAATNNNDDYWEPVPATVTGEGWYTVGLKAHMPSWFYPNNHNTGAQKLAVVIADGADLFPGMYMQIVDIRIDGVSYPCGDVTYGQTGYDNTMDGGVVAWDANDTYGLIYDQWMIDNAGTVDTGATWNSAGVAQKFDVFDVTALNDPSTIEIDFFLSSQQDVKPEGGPALRVIGEGPTTWVDIGVPNNLPTTAHMFWQDQDWWPATSANEDTYWSPIVANITGEGHYTVGVEAHMPSWFYPNNQNTGAQKLAVVITDGSTKFPGMYMEITDVRIDGVSYDVGDVTYGTTGYDNINSDDGTVYWASDDTYGLIYDSYMANPDNNGSIWGGVTWDSEATAQNFNIFDVSALNNPDKIEIDFFLSSKQDEVPEVQSEWKPEYDYTWYSNNTMGVAGYSLRDDLGIGNKWYNVVPVNLTKNGIYKIPLVASNMFVIGNAIVTVDGDNVTVDYETQHASEGNLTVTSECVKWFASIDEITADFANAPQSELAFGETISKAELGDVGYLFICNGVDFCQPITDNGIFLARYNHNHAMWKAYRAGLDAMVAELTPVVESPAAEVVESPAAEGVDSPVAE